MLKISELKVEYQNQEAFISTNKPAFSWILESDRDEVKQTAYQLLIKNESEIESKIVWDSGMVSSDQSICVEYKGEGLEEQTAYEAELHVSDNYGESAQEHLEFETTLFSSDTFTGKWITYVGNAIVEAPVFVKEAIINKKIARARLYASACGIYKVELNGKRVGEDYLTPGWTEYSSRIQFQTYDVTDYLKEESNRIEMTVAKGWYSGELTWICMPNLYGDKSAAFLELHIWYEDGGKDKIVTDASWNYTTGPVRYAEIYHGQTVDHTYISEKEKSVEVMDKDISVLYPQENIPVRIMEIRKPVEFIITPKGEKVLDFGQNMAGIVKVNVQAEYGQKVVIRHAETLDENGNFYTTNLRQARATDTFICKGGSETFIPEFTYHGFRYIQIEGIEEIHPEDFTALVLYSGMEEQCEFICDNPLVNQLFKNIIWGEKGNFVDIPTDCPQRDERLGWTGDAGIFSKTAAINMDVSLFFRKWLKDVAIGQKDIGTVPAVIPNVLGTAASGAAVWSDCVTLIPWNLYQIYGDKRILEDQYGSMKAWVDTLIGRETENHLIEDGFQYGDWLALDKEECRSETQGITNPHLIASVFYAVSTKIVADSARVLGKADDASKYYELAEKIRKAVNEEYITSTGRIVSESETAYAIMFYFDMIEEKYQERMKKLFVENIDMHQGKLSTGFVGTPFLCYALNKIGRSDLAGKIMLTEEYPGWLYAVKSGATTIWERWNSKLADGSIPDNGMNSLNHYAYGSIGGYMVEEIAGIQPVEPGYRKIRIAPVPVKSLQKIKVKQKTPYGIVKCAYEWKDYHMTVDVTIPANTLAEIRLPEKEESFEVGSGSYHYEYNVKMNLKADKYHVDMNIGELLQDEKVCELLESFQKGICTNLQGAVTFTVRAAAGMIPGIEELFQKVFEILNK